MYPARTLTSWLGPVRRPPTGGETLRDVDLFASGHYRGKDYTVADLDEMAANFAKLGPRGLKLLDPPACLGHEETQAYLERTDLPAAGWVRAVRVRKYHEPATGRTEAVLTGDIVGVPTSIANKIRKRLYRKVSAEVYADFTDDFGRSYGKALRRVAFLGAEVPQVKRIGDLPMPEPARFAEGAFPLRPADARRVRPGARDETVLCFSEVTRMGDPTRPPGRQTWTEAIRTAMPNLGAPTLDGMTDDQLADLAKNLPPTQPPAPEPPPMDPTQVPPPADPLGGLTRDEMIAELQAAGQDPAQLAAMSDEDLKALLAQVSQGGMAPMADGTAADDPAAGPTPEQMIAELTDLGEDPQMLAQLPPDELAALYEELTNPQASPTDVAAMSEFFWRVRARRTRRQPARPAANPHLAYAERVARRAAQFAGGQLAAATRADAEAFCDRLTKEGRLFPAHRAVFLQALLAADNLTPVKFSEKGVTRTLTAYERKKAELAQMPVVIRFGERVGGGTADDAKRGPDRQKRIVERFAEANAGSLKGSGKTPAQFVARFAELQAKDPTLTAAQLLGADAAARYDAD